MACLASLRIAADCLSIHTVVVDNASSDGSSDAVARTFPNVEVIQNSENLGFSRANNQALSLYKNDTRYVLLLNPDTVVSPDSFKNMLSFLDEHSEAGIAGCKIVTPQGGLDWACKRGFPTPSLLFYKALRLDKCFPNSPRFGRYNLTYLDPNRIHEVDSVVGAFMMIRRECLETVGLLDDSYFMYGEDIDFCFRAKEKGWKVFYVPTSTTIHHKGQSTRKRSYRMIYNWYQAIWKFYSKRVSPRYFAGTDMLVWCGLHFMCGISLVANLFRSQKKVPSRT